MTQSHAVGALREFLNQKSMMMPTGGDLTSQPARTTIPIRESPIRRGAGLIVAYSHSEAEKVEAAVTRRAEGESVRPKADASRRSKVRFADAQRRMAKNTASP